jgi:nicotine blue oxidoreductase
MGRPKALLPVRGRSAVEVVVATLRDAGCDPVIVVTGRHADEIRAGADLSGCTIVEHAGWAAGRTSSLQAGLRAVPTGADAVVLALVDMPLVRPETVGNLLTAWVRAPEGTDVVVPLHDGRGGHPIVLSPRVLPAIAGLGPDAPLRDLLRTRDRLDVEVDDPGVRLDLDTPDDLRHLPPA